MKKLKNRRNFMMRILLGGLFLDYQSLLTLFAYSAYFFSSVMTLRSSISTEVKLKKQSMPYIGYTELVIVT